MARETLMTASMVMCWGSSVPHVAPVRTEKTDPTAGAIPQTPESPQ